MDVSTQILLESSTRLVFDVVFDLEKSLIINLFLKNNTQSSYLQKLAFNMSASTYHILCYLINEIDEP